MANERLSVAEKPKIVTFGGGTGSPLTHESLFLTGEVDHVNAVVTPFDSGGATGRRRHAARGQEIAHSDSMRVLMSLTTPNGNPQAREAMKELFNSRHDVSDNVIGQEIMEQYFTPENAYAKVEDFLQKMNIHLRGRVLPASTVPSNIEFTTEHGRTFLGEHKLDEQSMSADLVSEMHLAPDVPAYPEALEAVKEAEIVIFSTGSLYGSVLAPLLPEGMREAVAGSNADIYMVTPMTSTRNETHEFRPTDFADKLDEYAGRRPSGLIVPAVTRAQFEERHQRAAELYATEHSHFLGWDYKTLKDAEKDGIEIITHDALKIVNKDGAESARHDPAKLAEAFKEVLRK